jgi:hypothetical protein
VLRHQEGRAHAKRGVADTRYHNWLRFQLGVPVIHLSESDRQMRRSFQCTYKDAEESVDVEWTHSPTFLGGGDDEGDSGADPLALTIPTAI